MSLIHDINVTGGTINTITNPVAVTNANGVATASYRGWIENA